MKKQPEDTSSFALVDIKLGRNALYKKVGEGYQIPVIIHGYIQAGTQPHGRDDGTSREFGVHVTEIHMGGPIIGPPSDKAGRVFALVKNVKAGDRIQLDGGFDESCGIKQGATRTVRADKTGKLYFNCGDGNKHYLDGQIGERGEYVGLYQV